MINQLCLQGFNFKLLGILTMKFKVGDGSSTKFWHDPWSEGLPWENNFTELYNISSNKEASVAELLSFEGENYN